MNRVIFGFAASVFLACTLHACTEADKKASGSQAPIGNEASMLIAGNEADYMVDSMTMKGFVSYDSSTMDKRPVVLVVPEWWGLGDYAKMRARMLAELGYIAFAVDMYGEGAYANDPTEAGKMAAPFYTNFAMAKKHFDAALAKVKTYPQADTTKIAAIGYCFGGAQVLNMARLGENLNGVVSFHGNLIGVTPQKGTIKAKILVCHGEADKFVPAEEVAAFKKQMDSVGVPFTFKSYPNATHAFTNPDATGTGQKFNMPIEYNKAADSASWNDMKAFFKEIF